jgi:hypothetical protein
MCPSGGANGVRRDAMVANDGKKRQPASFLSSFLSFSLSFLLFPFRLIGNLRPLFFESLLSPQKIEYKSELYRRSSRRPAKCTRMLYFGQGITRMLL